MLAVVTLYSVAKAIHIIGAIFAFGGTLAVPPIVAYLERQHPEAVRPFYGAVAHIGRTIVTPAMVVVLAAGIYLGLKADVMSEMWVAIPFLILIALFGLYGALIVPRAEELAKGTGPVGDGTVAVGDATALLARLHLLAAGLAVIAVLVMTLKPGA